MPKENEQAHRGNGTGNEDQYETLAMAHGARQSISVPLSKGGEPTGEAALETCEQARIAGLGVPMYLAAQQPGRHRRHERTREDERSDHRVDDGFSKRTEQIAGDA